MAGALSQTLIRESWSLARDLSTSTRLFCVIRSGGIARSPPSRLLGVRLRSGRPEVGQLLEIDLGQGADSSNVEVEVLSLRRLEDAIQVLLIQKSAPAWLPFVPGSSFWLPTMLQGRALGLRIPSQPEKSLTDEEELSRTTRLGWPSSSYFVDGIMPDHRSTKILTKSAAGPAAQSDEDE